MPTEHLFAAFAILFALGVIAALMGTAQADFRKDAAQLRDLLVQRHGALP